MTINDRHPSNAQAGARVLPLRVNFGWTFAGNVVNAACQWGVLAVLARLAGPAEVGQFGLGLAIAGPVITIAMLQLRSLLVTDARGECTFADYFGIRIFWTIVGLAAIVVFALASGLQRQAAIVVVLVGVAKCVDSVSDIVRGLFQRFERMDYAGISLMLRGPASLLAMGLTMYASHSLSLSVAVMAGTWLLILTAYELTVAAKLLRTPSTPAMGDRWAPRLHARALWRLTWTALPLGIVMGISSLQTNIPRYMLQGFVGEHGVGYFVALAYPMVAATMIATAMGQSALPRLTRLFRDDIAAYRRLLQRLVGLASVTGLGCVAVVLLFGKPILTLLYGSAYAEYHTSFSLLALATALQLLASCAGYALTAARYLRVQVLLISLSCIVAAAAGYALVSRWGVWGGALSVLFTNVVMLLAFAAAVAWAVRRRMQDDVPGSPHSLSVASSESAGATGPSMGAGC